MHQTSIVILCLLFLLLFYTQSQTTPSYLDSKHFYSNQIKAYLGSGESRTYNMPSTFLLSTLAHRSPFLTVCGAEHMKIEAHEFFYFYVEVSNVGITFFKLKITVQVIGFTDYGFADLTNLFIRYLVVLNTFPDIYISGLLDVSSTTYSITAGGFK